MNDNLAKQKKQIKIELKQGTVITGRLEGVDAYLNLKLVDVDVSFTDYSITSDDTSKGPFVLKHAMTSCFVRGHSILTVDLSNCNVDFDNLQCLLANS